MKFVYSDLLTCPLDHHALQLDADCLRCADGHAFDIARQGYVNLLGAADKRSRDPGDGKEMVAARRDFLNDGHYQPVADKLANLVKPQVNTDSTIVDAGCGEGYYLEQLETQIESSSHCKPTIIGFDISKWAVQAATRRLAATWLVASNRNIPLAANSADCLLSLFGFPVFNSFRSVLKEGGTLLMVDAGPQHLIELRKVIYPEVRRSDSTMLQQACAAGFLEGETSTLQFQTDPLSQLQIHQLLSMTPHLFRATREGKERATRLDHFPVTVDIVFQRLHKGGNT
ncbi:MAG: methyltransferase domain-containing protein [Halioglobus sp.]|jgi:23S rRNA (guanine745-N1)-methyltransferase|nr:methyltransferase domain-containing protein [Halioglobus sp.]